MMQTTSARADAALHAGHFRQRALISNSAKRCTISSVARSCRCSTPSPEEVNTHDRRQTILSLSTAVLASFAAGDLPAAAVQGLTAGRLPGITGPDSDGFYMYKRPEGKSGGHGTGWSEMARYSFKLPPLWEETPVSIADGRSAELDARFASSEGPSLFILVAPVLRFKEIGNNADVRIDFLGTPEQIISGFAPEIFGTPLNEGDVLATEVVKKDGVPYYQWEVKPHNLVTATAVGNRLFLMVITANSRQWRKAESQLRVIQQSFFVPADT